MNHSPIVSALRELVDLGLIAVQPTAQLLSGGNADRRDRQARISWRVTLPDGRPVRLVLAPQLAALAKIQTEFAEACPDLVPAPIFHQVLSQGEAFAELFIEGSTLETATCESASRVQADFARTCTMLAAAVRPSTEVARLAEWQDWTSSIESLELWTRVEKSLLNTLIWPRLYPLLCEKPPSVRWSNGDFTSTNILLDQSGVPHLIDHEFAHKTHFYAEDAARFYSLSPIARQRPELFHPSLPLPGPAWHLFFWLRQLQLESVHNTASYLNRMRSERLGVIRRLSEEILCCQLIGWSVEPAAIQYTLEIARWEHSPKTTLRLSGWCHIPANVIRSIVLSQGDNILANAAPEERLDVQDHFAGETSARTSGFNLAIPLRDPDASLVISAVTNDGTFLPFHFLGTGDLPRPGPWIDDYTRWAEHYDPDPLVPLAEPLGSLFSILLPVYNTPPDILRACIESVRKQHYEQWELCIVDDASSVPVVRSVLSDYARRDERIKIQYRTSNGGIARATNDALHVACGEFVVLLDHDDLLRPHTLARFAERLRLEPTLDAVYSDEDKITVEGVRVIPFLKPDFSPEFLLGVMYIGHALCVRTTIARATNGFDPVFDGIQDYEFFLRVTEKTKRIGHISRILYHWRQSPSSSASDGNVKGDMDSKHAAAVRNYLLRQGRIQQVALYGRHRLRLIGTSASPVEIVRLTTGDDAMTALHNAAKASPATVLILLAIEPQTMSENWQCELATLAERPDSGLVAPLLLSREGRVLESGWTFGPDGAVPLMRGFDATGDGYNGSLLCCREVAAVSPVCCAIRRELAITALAIAPFGETWLEFCTRLLKNGLFHRVCPAARLQLNSSWRDPIISIGSLKNSDPFFNPHFDARRGDYSLARPPVHLSPILWHIDSPYPLVVHNGCMEFRGWCFVSDGRQVRTIRVRAGGLEFFGTMGLPRPDVKAALPEAPDNYAGFDIRGVIPAGRTNLLLEVMLSDETWHRLAQCLVEVKRQLLPLWLRGGSWVELIFKQTPTFMTHMPRKVRVENFPKLTRASLQPNLSIVTPSYQQAHFLEKTMRSVLEQRGVDCQYVVQDGGSKDGSQELIEGIAEKLGGTLSTSGHPPQDVCLEGRKVRLIAWESAPDAGQADAILKGFAKTSGGPDDLMAWINSDDFYAPGALAYIVSYFARHPEVDLVYGHRIVVNEDSLEIARWFLPKHDNEVLRLNDFIPQETMFWRRRIWGKTGGLDRSFQFAMDWDLLVRFQAAGAKIVRVPHFLAYFRVHPAQKTSAAMHDLGQKEITLIRERTQGRPFPTQKLENNPLLIRYLRRSAFLKFMWKLGLRFL